MNRIFLLLVLCFSLSGCSLLKMATSPFKQTVTNVPQSVVKGKKIIKCAGDLKISEDGTVITCTKGFYLYNENSITQERKLTIKEKIVQFFNNLMGWSFWIVLALVFICPSLIGVIIGRFFEAIYGIGTKTLRQVTSAVQKVKDTTPTLTDALEKSTDEDVKAFIKKFKEQNCIK